MQVPGLGAAGVPLGQEVRGAYMQLLCWGRVVAELSTDFRLNARMTAELEALQPISVDQMKLYPARLASPADSSMALLGVR